MCQANRSTRRSTRGTRRGDRFTEAKKAFFSNTVSTSPSCSRSGDGKRSCRLAAGNRFQEVHRKVCPVTGILRDISDDYHLSPTLLGKGSYGTVRECEHRATSRILAVKSIDKSKVRRLDYLRREVYLLHKMNHQGIMKLVDFYEDTKYVHIVTERYTGGTLFSRVKENTTSDGCFSEYQAARIIKLLLEVVAYLHDHDTVHRDIKPENILFESSREDASIRLIDFGLSRKHKRGHAPMDKAVGTVYYKAPELLERQYDRSCDVWSVGIIAYVLLCGYLPFGGESHFEVTECIKKGNFGFAPEMAWSSKSDDARDFIHCLLRMDPSKRPTAKEALSHNWLKTNAGDGVKSNNVKQPDDVMGRIQSLRNSLPSFRHWH